MGKISGLSSLGYQKRLWKAWFWRGPKQGEELFQPPFSRNEENFYLQMKGTERGDERIVRWGEAVWIQTFDQKRQKLSQEVAGTMGDCEEGS